MYETSCRSRFNARHWMLGASALGRPRGMVWGGRREEGSGWGTHVYLWQIHFAIWQNQYNIVKLKFFFFKFTKKKKRKLWYIYTMGYYSAIKKNTFEFVLKRWMKLEPIIKSEVSQKEKPIQYTNAYIWNLERR